MSHRTDVRRAVTAYVALYAAVGALYPYLPVYYEALGFEVHEIGLLAAAYAAAAMIGAPLWGASADWAGAARPLVSLAAAAAVVAAGVLAVTTGTVLVAIAAMGLALATAGITPILDAWAIDVVGAKGAGYSRLRVWGSASFIVAVVVTGRLVEVWGIRALFAILVPALLATALVGLGIRSRPAPPPLSRLAPLRSVARSTVIMPFLAVILLAWTAAAAINAFFSIHLVAVGAPATLVGVSWAIGAAVEVPIMLAFAQLARRVGLMRLLIIGAALFAFRALAIVVIDDPILVTLTMLLHGAGFALVLVGGVMYVAEHAPTGASGSAQGVLAATGFGLAQVLGPGIGGLLGGMIGLRAMFAIAGLASAVAVGALALVLGKASARTRPVGDGTVAEGTS